jgi:hypothetical protein
MSFRVPQSVPDRVIHRELGESAVAEVSAELAHLKEVMVAKDAVLNLVKDTILKQNPPDYFSVRPYGSTSVLLCEAESDVDICVQILPAALTPKLEPLRHNHVGLSRHFLENSIMPAASNIFVEMSPCLNKDVPVIKAGLWTPIDFMMGSSM